MPRIRTIKPEFWTDGKNLKQTPVTRLIFIAIWNFSDDEGKCRMDLHELSARLGGEWKKSKLKKSIEALIASGQLRISKDNEWIQVVHWLDHQVINRPRVPKILASDIEWEGQNPTRNIPLRPVSDPEIAENGSDMEILGSHPVIFEDVNLVKSIPCKNSFSECSRNVHVKKGKERNGMYIFSSPLLKGNFIFPSLGSPSNHKATCERDKENGYNYDTSEKERIRCTITRPAQDFEDLSAIVGKDFWQREEIAEEGFAYTQQMAKEALNYHLSGKSKGPAPRSRNEWERTLKYWIHNPENLDRYRKMKRFDSQRSVAGRPAAAVTKTFNVLRSNGGQSLNFSMKSL